MSRCIRSEQPDDALHRAVVVSVADRPDGWRDALQGQVLGEPNRGVLRAGVAVTDQLPGADRMAVAVAVPQRDPQRGEDEISPLIGACMPSDDALGEHINDERDVAEPRPRSAHT